ncbi:hypothetical protein LINPERPRIM_LOCUS18626 [Linum perenne]
MKVSFLVSNELSATLLSIMFLHLPKIYEGCAFTIKGPLYWRFEHQASDEAHGLAR